MQVQDSKVMIKTVVEYPNGRVKTVEIEYQLEMVFT